MASFFLRRLMRFDSPQLLPSAISQTLRQAWKRRRQDFASLAGFDLIFVTAWHAWIFFFSGFLVSHWLIGDTSLGRSVRRKLPGAKLPVGGRYQCLGAQLYLSGEAFTKCHLGALTQAVTWLQQPDRGLCVLYSGNTGTLHFWGESSAGNSRVPDPG